MLIRITERCNMACWHCMLDAKSTGIDMDTETFVRAVAFAGADNLVMFSGGEPTLHPRLLRFISIAKRSKLVCTLVSNGTFADDAALTKKLVESDVIIQVTNDPRYYPRAVKRIYHPRILYEDSLRTIVPLGRARGWGSNRKGPLCFNLRSATASLGSLLGAITFLRGRGMYCTPSIDADGTIRAGESNQCYALGTVRDTMDVIKTRLLAMTCNACGLEDRLDERQRNALRRQA